MRRAHADLAGLAGFDLLVVVVEDLDLAGGDRKAAGQEQLRRLRIMVGLAQHRDRIAFGLAVELREHRADPLDALDQPARRHRRGAVEQQFERGEIGLVERGMIEQHIDHGRHEQREIDALALDGLQHRLGIETLQHVHGAAAHQRRQHLGAGDMADRRDREIARRLGNLEVGEDRVGEAAISRGGSAARPWICRWCRRCSSASRYRRGRRGSAAWRCPRCRSRPADRRRSRPAPSVNTVFRSAPWRRDRRRDRGTCRRRPPASRLRNPRSGTADRRASPADAAR